MNKSLLIVFFLLVTVARAQESVRISILTTTPGNLPHTMFGHSAIRVIDKARGLEKVYNFGIFDFESSNFVLKFLRGDLEYWLGRQSMEGFIELNNKEGREIREQLLNLSFLESATIYKELKFLHKSENRFYRYSFTSKNCSTKIRDLLLRRSLLNTAHSCDASYREVLMPYVVDAPWLRFGINLILGSPNDQRISCIERLFLPKDLQKCIADTPGLVLEDNVLNQVKKDKSGGVLNFLSSPLVVFSLLTVFVFFRPLEWVSLLACCIIGGFALFISFIWLITRHPELTNNLNLLWCNPFYLFYIPLGWKKRNTKFLSIFLLGSTTLALIVWIFGFQIFDIAVIPLICLLSLINLRAAKLIPDRLTKKGY